MAPIASFGGQPLKGDPVASKDRARKPQKRKAEQTLKEKRAAKRAKRDVGTKPQMPA